MTELAKPEDGDIAPGLVKLERLALARLAYAAAFNDSAAGVEAAKELLRYVETTSVELVFDPVNNAMTEYQRIVEEGTYRGD